ncbi:Predicted amino acid racemase [Anaerosphaera aminiphila DSM 21120]|uniref:Predicted amino acid racemase n=1 Tax=Anaerosphaera aminiphila DSM 21120 TaxID=1120995 RepID=A0A1M5Q9Q4_9FIRM|nr:alanine/ornithine racemase family PLP-dependent enzyme [Anaerosphaera aminiphila]SHH10887.1 Predicted amino acid racemase [Anaerosphaera aminiphila DSM 21120]
MTATLEINLKKIENNVSIIKNLCDENNIEITGITKMFSGDPKIANMYLSGGLEKLGDSEISNLKNLSGIEAEKWMVRIPALSEIEDLIKYSDASLNSELEVIKEIEKQSKKQGKIHKIILMQELGDLREGILDREELIRTADYVLNSKWIELYGMGTNLTCLSFVQPSVENLSRLVKMSKEVFGNRKFMISGGNSSSIDLMLNKKMPVEINNLRLGESLIFGKERAKYKYLDGTYSDTFVLKAEIVEIKEKPSFPWGKIGADSYGRTPTFTDRGIRKRAICAVGRKSMDVGTTKPCDSGVGIVGASSDHLMLDISDSNKNYKIGDKISLKLGYASALLAMNSTYIKKEYITEI